MEILRVFFENEVIVDVEFDTPITNEDVRATRMELEKIHGKAIKARVIRNAGGGL